MNNLNSIILEGNLVKTPELYKTSKGISLCHLSVAVNRWFKQESGMGKEVSFFDVDAWGNLAQTAAEKGEKGQGIRIVGRLKQERWIDANDGKNRSKVVVVAEHIEFKPMFSGATEHDAKPEAENAEEEEPLAVNW